MSAADNYTDGSTTRANRGVRGNKGRYGETTFRRFLFARLNSRAPPIAVVTCNLQPQIAPWKSWTTIPMAKSVEQVRERVWPSIREFAIAIEHMGSTSVSGLAAKPVLDIDVVIPSRNEIQLAITRVSTLAIRIAETWGSRTVKRLGLPRTDPLIIYTFARVRASLFLITSHFGITFVPTNRLISIQRSRSAWRRNAAVTLTAT